MNPEQALHAAVGHHQAGRLAEAEGIYRQILARQPNHPDALNLLGVLAGQLGRDDAAVELIEKSIAANPAVAEAHFNLGDAYRRTGKLEQALGCLRNALRLKPNFAEAHASLGGTLGMMGRFGEAIAACTTAVRLQPDHVPARNNLGLALQGAGRHHEAIAAFTQAVAVKPDYAPSHNNLGTALQAAGRLEEAIAAFDRAVRLQPTYVPAHNNLAIALQAAGRADAALNAFAAAIRLDPGQANVHWNHALALLINGDFDRGWAEHEWRLKCKESPSRHHSKPMWDGTNLAGKTILLHAEQGMGDAIQFVRYAPLVAGRGGRVVLECHPPLARLFRTLPGVEQVIAMGEPLPAFDVHCPLLSLPHVFHTRLDSIPSPSPYLHADANLAQTWREKLRPYAGRLKVGLVWAGSRSNPNDGKRSLRPEQLAPLAGVAGVQFFSLQKVAPGEPSTTVPRELPLIDYTAELNDFADTAGLLANLDMVVTVDTAAAHLAGTMGREVWVMLPFAPDWRWMLGRSDSPWYASMRLFRQPTIGDWHGTINAVREALATRATRAIAAVQP